MVCQICGGTSGKYPLCKECFNRRDAGLLTKCNDCGKWKNDNKPLCYECWRKNNSKKDKSGQETEEYEAPSLFGFIREIFSPSESSEDNITNKKCKSCGEPSGNFPLCKKCYAEQNKDKNPTELVPDYDKDFRKRFPTDTRTDDGHYVRSLSEKIIADWLFGKKIRYEYERKAPISEDLYSDFYLPDGDVWIEFWGLNEEKYLERKRKKQNLYRKYNYNLVELEQNDINRIPDVLPTKLRRYMPNFRF